jgi:hypothetical protein
MIMPCFHLYPRIIRNTGTGGETGETEEKLCFSRKRKGREKRSRPTQLRIRPSPPSHAATGPKEELLDEEEQEYAS